MLMLLVQGPPYETHCSNSSKSDVRPGLPFYGFSSGYEILAGDRLYNVAAAIVPSSSSFSHSSSPSSPSLTLSVY